jgi:antitoxin ParD1/3/4
MQISLSQKAEAFVREQLATGEYSRADDVVERAIELLEEQARYWTDLNRKIAEAAAELDAGESIPGNEAFALARKAVLQRIAPR